MNGGNLFKVPSMPSTAVDPSAHGKPPECAGCPLIDALGPVPSQRPEESQPRLALVGEAPGPDEVKRWNFKPFVGRAGFVLNIALKAAGISREMCYIGNVVRCLPYVPVKGTPTDYQKTRFRKPTQHEASFCSSRFLLPELRALKPTCVVALGATASEWLTRDGVERPPTAWRGTVLEVPDP